MKQQRFRYAPGERQAERELATYLASLNGPAVDTLSDLRQLLGE